MMKVLIVALALTAGACASASGRLVLTEDAIHDSLAKVDDGVRTICTGDAAVALKAPCSDARAVLIPTLESGAAFNRAVSAGKVDSLAPLMEAIGRLVTALRALPTGQTATLILELSHVIAAAYAVVQGGAQ